MQRGFPRCEMRNVMHFVASVKAPEKLFSGLSSLRQPSSFRQISSRLFDGGTLPDRPNDNKGLAQSKFPATGFTALAATTEPSPQPPSPSDFGQFRRTRSPGFCRYWKFFNCSANLWASREQKHETSYRRCRSCGINRICGDGRLAVHRLFFFGPFSRPAVRHSLARCLHLPPGKPVRLAGHPVRLGAVLLAAAAPHSENAIR